MPRRPSPTSSPHPAGDEHSRATPRRVAAAYAEMLRPRSCNLTTFPNDEGYDELVPARDIPFHSQCQHHMMPFQGVARIGYLPGDRILGLSKLAWGGTVRSPVCQCRSA